jgi:hypothetical protein
MRADQSWTAGNQYNSGNRASSIAVFGATFWTVAKAVSVGISHCLDGSRDVHCGLHARMDRA